MRFRAILAALAVSGCGVIYTSPDVHEGRGGFGLSGQTDFDVAVVPLTFETAAAANLAPYVPARLPAAFRPTPGAVAPAMRQVGGGIPSIPSPRVNRGAGALTGETDLPGEATPPPGAPPELETRLPPPVEQSPYRIGVSDVVLLSVDTSSADISAVPGLIAAQSKRQGYVVQDDGAIAIPDVGRVQLAGLTIEDAEAAVFEALVENRIDPSFSLEVAEFNSQRVSIGGEVRNPTVAPITLKPLKLVEALQLAGGAAVADPDYTVIRIYRDGEVYQIPLEQMFDDTALPDVTLKDGDSIYVDDRYEIARAQAYFQEQLRLREADLREREFQFRQRQADIDEAQFAIAMQQFALQRAQLAQNIQQMRIAVANYNAQREAQARAIDADQRAAFKDRLELGAVARDYVYLAGEVEKQGRFPLPFENRSSLADVLFEEGGIPIETGDFGEIYVLRASPRPEEFGGLTAYHLDAANAANLVAAAQFEVRPNDVVFVSEQPVTTWRRVINQLSGSIFVQAANVAQ